MWEGRGRFQSVPGFPLHHYLSEFSQGVQTYLPEDPTAVMLESLITWIFLSEVLLKFLSTLSRPYCFFLEYDGGKVNTLLIFFVKSTLQASFNAWNFFDLVVVILSYFFIFLLSFNIGEVWTDSLKLMRLLFCVW